MKKFTKPEIISLIVIFLILTAVAVPNFVISLMRSRDQIRRDDLGSLNHALDQYLADFEKLPSASADGYVLGCLAQGEVPVKDKKGNWTYNPIPCQWGQDSFANLITGRVYLQVFPNDPDYEKGVKYLYFSDGNRYQIYAAMEASDAPEIDPKVVARNLSCGSRICNVGRSYNVPIDVSIEEYNKQFGD
jgi:type II secretory pathway pseudopilin PulG